LPCCVLYVLDISEQCGYSIQQQVALFDSIRPLFHNKPIVVAINKVDVRKREDLTPSELVELDKLESSGATVMFMSTFSDEGVTDVKTSACELLLAQRVEQKMAGSKIESVINRIRVSEPKPRAGAAGRKTAIPASVTARRAAMVVAEREAEAARKSGGGGGSSTDLPEATVGGKRRTQKDLQEEMGGAGVYSLPLQTHWQLKTPEWVHDVIPEIMDGKNILDFVDPDIDARLAELEEEEEQRVELADLQRQEAEAAEMMDDERADAQAAVKALAKTIRKKKSIIKEKARNAKSNNHSKLGRSVAARGRSVGEFVDHMASMGVKTTGAALPNLAAAAKKRTGGADALPARERRRDRSADAPEVREGRAGLKRNRDGMDVDSEAGDGGQRSESQMRLRANQIPRDRSATARDAASQARARSPSASGLRDEAALKKATKLGKKQQFKMNKHGYAGESDRRVMCQRPKHLNSGKRGIGKTDRR
jgi:nucleolar GTP-binding protein